MNRDIPSAEQAYDRLLGMISGAVSGRAADERIILVGIHTGGAWVAQRIADDLDSQDDVRLELGFLSSAFHRDDYGKGRGLSGAMKATDLPLSIDEARVILIDDVLFTGRTVRAVLNELFDHGRPHRVELAVLVDRGGRQLPIEPTYCGVVADLPTDRNFRLVQDDSGRLTLEIV